MFARSNYAKCWLIRAERSDQEVRVQSVVFALERADGSGACVYDNVTVYTLKWGKIALSK